MREDVCQGWCVEYLSGGRALGLTPYQKEDRLFHRARILPRARNRHGRSPRAPGLYSPQTCQSRCPLLRTSGPGRSHLGDSTHTHTSQHRLESHLGVLQQVIQTSFIIIHSGSKWA